MKRSISCIILILIMFFTGSLDADEYPGWSGYPPVFSMNDVIEFGGNVYGATKGGMFRYDPLLREYKLYYKNHGLISNNVLCIGATSQKIYIGNIFLISHGYPNLLNQLSQMKECYLASIGRNMGNNR